MGKPYYEICNHNALKIIYEPWAVYTSEKLEWKNGKMDVPYAPNTNTLDRTMISFDSEILQTFVEASNISHVDIEQYSFYDDSGKLEQADFHLQIGSYACSKIGDRSECLMPQGDYTWTIFTKEGFKQDLNKAMT